LVRALALRGRRRAGARLTMAESLSQRENRDRHVEAVLSMSYKKYQ
jgi:hypothetical protein